MTRRFVSIESELKELECAIGWSSRAVAPAAGSDGALSRDMRRIGRKRQAGLGAAG